MRQVITYLQILFIILTFNIDNYGQHTERCSTTSLTVSKRIEADQAYAHYHRKHVLSLSRLSHDRNPGCQQGPVIIPVAVHFNGGIVPSGQETCAIELVIDQLSALNAEINGNDPQNNAFAVLQACFPENPSIGESCISFCLAKYDHPYGYGLTPGNYAVTFGQIDFEEISPGSYHVPFDENWAGYLNIFITDLPGGLLGESAGIPGMFNGEGVVIDACAFGTGNFGCEGMNSSYSCGGIYNEGNTLVHETGHYLGLFHIWGDNAFCSGYQDGIEDTPNMTSSYSGYTSCQHSSCSELPSTCDSKDMYMNYMSYASDGCMYMFTGGQAEVMHTSALNAGFSHETPIKCITPQFPVASFEHEPVNAQLCPNLPFIHLFDTSTGPAENRTWTFAGCGVIPESSNAEKPVIQVKSSGTLTIQLTVSNYIGTSETFIQEIPVELLNGTDPVCNSCNYQLELEDSYGDGWNGAMVEIKLDGQSAGIFTLLNGMQATYDFPVSSGQDLEILFTGGAWDEEVSFSIKDAFGVEIFYQGVNPSDGLLYAGISNCSVCGYQFLDSGGLYGDYKNSENKERTFCPPAYFDKISLSFDMVDIELEQNCVADQLKFYNGVDESELISSYCGYGPVSDVISTAENGCLHVDFTSDASVTKNGWLATVHCLHHCHVVTNTGDDGPNTLKSAIACAESGDTVWMHPFLIGDTIFIETGPILIDKPITILGQINAYIINSEQTSTLFHILPQGYLLLEGLQIRGKSGPEAPVILNEGQLILKNTQIEDSFSGENMSLKNTGALQTEGFSRIIKIN